MIHMYILAFTNYHLGIFTVVVIRYHERSSTPDSCVMHGDNILSAFVHAVWVCVHGGQSIYTIAP